MKEDKKKIGREEDRWRKVGGKKMEGDRWRERRGVKMKMKK